MELHPLTNLQRAALTLLSLVIVAFGQPTWCWWCGLIAAAIGYALFWRVLLDIPRRSHRFLVATAWFTVVQLVLLSWANSHPYLYIYVLYPLFALLLGTQFGILGVFITPQHILRFSHVLSLAALWTLMEWIRLFFFSGYSLNPAGMALAGGLYPLQLASFWGVFGLSFWVVFVNLLALRAWCSGFIPAHVILWATAALLPYFYGATHIQIHEDAMAQHHIQTPDFHAVLVQTNFSADNVYYHDRKKVVFQAIDDWSLIISTLKKQQGQSIDLIVLPEYAVPCGTYTCLYPHNIVVKAFSDTFGKDSLKSLPALEEPFAKIWETEKGKVYFVNNAFWAQGIANYFQAGLVIGLEDVDEIASGEREHYSAAVYFKPNATTAPTSFEIQRYEKRVLVPLGEYVPFALFKSLLASYGIQGSFTCGKEAKVFVAAENVPFGLSICYEETFGNLMRENKQRGAGLLVNLTSDAWYPNSRLPYQHFTHAVLRTVESGIPLIRSSNLGITGAVDSLGRTVALLGEDEVQPDALLDSLRVKVPMYTYSTLYSHVGDGLIIGFCFVVTLYSFGRKRWKGKSKDEKSKDER